MEQEIMYPNRPYGQTGFLKRISWSAVFAGVLIAIVTQMLLTLLGLGIGLATIDPLEESRPMAGLGVGSAIWYIVSSLLSLFIGGWVAGRLASAPRRFDGIIHGVLTWCLTTLLTIYFLTTTVGSIIGGASRLVGGIVKTAGAGVAAVAPGIGNAIEGQLQRNGIDINNLDLNDLQREFNQVLRQTGDPDLQPGTLERRAGNAVDQAQNTAEQAAKNPQSADEMASGLFNKLFRQGKQTIDNVDREDAVNVVMQRTGQSRAQAEQTVDGWITTYQQAATKLGQTAEEVKATANQAADAAAAAASKAAIFGFFGLLIGLGAAGFGAKMGTDSKDEYNRLDPPVHEVVV